MKIMSEDIAIELGVKKRTLWCKELRFQTKKLCSMSGKFDSKKFKGFSVHVVEALPIDFICRKCSAMVGHVDRHEPLADIGDSPGERVAYGGR